jgi:adenylate cyclase
MLEASQLADEHLALVESIGDPGLAFGGMLIKAQVAEMGTAMAWAQTIIDWADGDPTKGNLVVGSPLAAAYSMRGLGRWWYGRSGWREDIDESIRLARTADPLTLAVVVAWRGGVGRLAGVLLPEDELALVRLAVRTAEESGDDYAVDMAQTVLASVLLDIDDEDHRTEGLELLTRNRELCLAQRYPMSELPLTEFGLARERFRRGLGRDEALGTMRESLNLLFERQQLTYAVPATRHLVSALLERGDEGDSADADRTAERLAGLDADGSVIRDLWLLHCRALVAHARGDDAYAELRDRYRATATSLAYGGHMAWAEALP